MMKITRRVGCDDFSYHFFEDDDYERWYAKTLSLDFGFEIYDYWKGQDIASITPALGRIVTRQKFDDNGSQLLVNNLYRRLITASSNGTIDVATFLRVENAVYDLALFMVLVLRLGVRIPQEWQTCIGSVFKKAHDAGKDFIRPINNIIRPQVKRPTCLDMANDLLYGCYPNDGTPWYYYTTRPPLDAVNGYVTQIPSSTLSPATSTHSPNLLNSTSSDTIVTQLAPKSPYASPKLQPDPQAQMPTPEEEHMICSSCEQTVCQCSTTESTQGGGFLEERLGLELMLEEL